MKRLCGVNPPVITIFDERHKVDIEASKRQADFLISKGVDGLAYLGTSGEFSIMTVEEKKNFINEMIKIAGGYPITEDANPSAPWMDYSVEAMVAGDPDIILMASDQPLFQCIQYRHG